MTGALRPDAMDRTNASQPLGKGSDMTADRRATHPFHEFFAGSGLVSCGLAGSFRSVWANDISGRKAAVYEANLGSGAFHLGDISDVDGGDLPRAELSWASFPCQDLSLAGNIEGIYSERSGLVWQWLRILDEQGETAPRVVCLENVAGLVSAHGGDDYRHLHRALVSRGYKVGAVLINAREFIPQSRPRVFVIGTKGRIPAALIADAPTWAHPSAVSKAARTVEGFVYWSIPRPSPSGLTVSDVVEKDAPFDKDAVTALIPEKQLAKLRSSDLDYVTGYRRTRGGKQVLELRCDGIAGCLRTPAGGSSRQYLIHRQGEELHARLLTVREVARLMGAPEDFKLPGSYNDGYFAMGDAVAVPVARHLSRFILRDLVEAAYGA